MLLHTKRSVLLSPSMNASISSTRATHTTLLWCLFRYVSGLGISPVFKQIVFCFTSKLFWHVNESHRILFITCIWMNNCNLFLPGCLQRCYQFMLSLSRNEDLQRSLICNIIGNFCHTSLLRLKRWQALWPALYIKHWYVHLSIGLNFIFLIHVVFTFCNLLVYACFGLDCGLKHEKVQSWILKVSLTYHINNNFWHKAHKSIFSLSRASAFSSVIRVSLNTSRVTLFVPTSRVHIQTKSGFI